MKKKGFTLAEALISLAIVGIIAAIAAPMINRYKPDEDKITFLRTYDSIVEIINNIANNTHLYPLVDASGNDYTDNPLENTVTITNYNGTSYPSSGNDKLCEILADAFKTTPTTCATGDLDLSKVNFTTPDGVDFYMKGEKPKDTEGNETGPYTITIKFDINGGSSGCVYNENSCKKPDQFEVFVSSAGKVMASDVVSQKYLQTRGSYRKTDLDLEGIEKVETLPDAFDPCKSYEPKNDGHIQQCHAKYCKWSINDNRYFDKKCAFEWCKYFLENQRLIDYRQNSCEDIVPSDNPCEVYSPQLDGYNPECEDKYCEFQVEIMRSAGENQVCKQQFCDRYDYIKDHPEISTYNEWLNVCGEKK